MSQQRNNNTAKRQAAEQEAEFREALADGRKALELLGKRHPMDWGTPQQRDDYLNRKAMREAQRRCRELLREIQQQVAECELP